MYPGRKNPLFTEDGIRATIQGNLEAIESRLRPAVIDRIPYKPFKSHPHYTGFMALYVHYLYVLGKIEKRQYPPRMTPRLRKDVMRFEQYREQFAFLRDNNIVSQEDMTAFQSRTEDDLDNFMKQRTILNVRKKSKKFSMKRWRMRRLWPRPRRSTRKDCPAWKQSSPGTWRRRLFWNRAMPLS